MNLGDLGHRHQGKINPVRAHNPAESYDLWQDLCKAKANISFGQLIQIAPSLRKEMKEGATNHRKPKNMSVAVRVAPEDNDLELNEQEEDDVFGFGPVEIEVEVMDKVIPHVIVDDGSNVNIMPESTMLRLGLFITGPSPWKVKLADQRPSKPLGQIKDLGIRAGDEEYTVTFYVLHMHDEDGGYPLLLGRKWLRLAGGIVNWQAKAPYISFGPQNNRTIVPVLPHGPFKPRTFNMKNKVDPTIGADASFIQTNSCTNIDPIKCIGPGLYGFENDGSFTQWLLENPYEEGEVTIHFIEAIELLDLDDDCPDLATLVDDIFVEDVYGLEIDGTQIEDLDAIMREETILPSPLHFQQTSDGLQVGPDVSIYPSVPNDWYHGPTDPIHVIENDWVKVPVHHEDEEPKYVKLVLN
jgi:hypothetical protein